MVLQHTLNTAQRLYHGGKVPLDKNGDSKWSRGKAEMAGQWRMPSSATPAIGQTEYHIKDCRPGASSTSKTILAGELFHVSFSF